MDDDPWADTPATPPPPPGRVSSSRDPSGDADAGTGAGAAAVPAAEEVERAVEQPEDDDENETSHEEPRDEAEAEAAPAHEEDAAPEPEPPSEATPPHDDAFASDDIDAGFADVTEPDSYAAAPALAPPPAGGGFDDDGFDDFDDFGASAAGPSSAAFDAGGGFDDDGFGDFGDVQEFEGGFVEPEAAPAPAPAVESWSTLSLRPVPPRRELLQRITAVLYPLAADTDAFTDEPMRDVDELHQVLVAESSRVSYAKLTTAPILKPLDWTRSRVRRDHLIAMGVPVNLDEVDSHRLAALPPLHISTKGLPASAGGNGKGKARESYGGSASASAPASAAPHTNGSAERSKYGLGEQPIVDVPRAEELCGLDEDALSIMPLARLRALQAELERHTADGSALLAWFLQLKDAQKQDADTYNGMISELIANAAKVKQPGSGGGLFRRGSGRSRPGSMSASATPRRVASPGVFSG
ncbi:hypothetical protein VHUM_01540 [Vanrija humicola]|uniref:Uncharacterized protein n=1 Tax=Vanrija humicola TaxID=5417 RepID=A0A7D8V3C1_VANHU|nr:hypothetical protein VHUM_01540 [Vanrija humicola]